MEESPLVEIAESLNGMSAVSVVKFDKPEDQLREPLLSEMLTRLRLQKCDRGFIGNGLDEQDQPLKGVSYAG